MPKKPGANLYKDAARWPVIPPWWLLSSTQAAALINVTSATLHYWRTRGEGPPSVPPLFLKPTQGDPVFFVYGHLRSWAAERVGVEYGFNDQCYDYFNQVLPVMAKGSGGFAFRAKFFDEQFAEARKKILQGECPGVFRREIVIDADAYYAKQPKWRRSDAKYEWEELQSTQ